MVEELGKLGPRFLCTARGWQRAGDGPATAARPSPAAASHGRILALSLMRAAAEVSYT